MASVPTDGAYYAFAIRYREHRVACYVPFGSSVVQPSNGSLDNLALLEQHDSGVQAGP